MSSSRLPPRAPRTLRPTWRTLAAGMGFVRDSDSAMLRLEEHRKRAMVKQACTALQRRCVQHPLARKRARSLADQWREVSRVSRATRARRKARNLASSIAKKWNNRSTVGIKKVVSWLSIKKQRKPLHNRIEHEAPTTTATASA